MKIIQSYAHFDEGSPYLNKTNNDKKILNFYSFLLSYYTLNEFYGDITMYCDKNGYDNLVKYIPYDNIIHMENENSFKFWSYYKVDVIREMEEDFIHVDSDVFIFDKIFDTFINRVDYDLLVQDKIPANSNCSFSYVGKNVNYLVNNNIFDPKMYDGRCFSCGTLGMRIKNKDIYLNVADNIKKGFEIKESKIDYIGMICEELALYLTKLKHNLNAHEILPYEEILKLGVSKTGGNHNYTHMYLNTKFQEKYVKLIRDKLIKRYPKSIKYIEEYERSVMNKSKLLEAIC